MVYFKDNPNLTELKVVTTINGEKEYRKNCKFIREQYYIINKDCHEINGTWYRVKEGNIVYDWETRQYALKNTGRLIRGLVKNDQGELELGYFTPNIYNNIPTNSNKFGGITAISADILNQDWFEDMKHHIWRYAPEHSATTVLSCKVIKNSDNPANRGYNIEDNAGDLSQKTTAYNEYPTVISPKIKQLAKYLGDLTFGFEFEIAIGALPPHLQFRNGVVPCRDGSLHGGMEYVTIPMQGTKGLQTIVNLTEDLKIRSEISLDCSMHIHFGNFGTDKLSIIALYLLCRNIQNELFTMFPYYKTSPSGIKQKNYTKKLQKLNIGILVDQSKDAYEAYLLDSWNKLFKYYGEGEVTLDTFNKKTRKHPITDKWRCNSRYHVFNFLNLFFSHRHTLEARLHGPTTNKDKTVNWMLICAAIIRYSQKYAKQIITNDKTISLKEILEIFPTLYPSDKKASFLSKYLYNYFLERQERCRKDMNKGDYVSMWDIDEDKQYKYNYLNENILE